MLKVNRIYYFYWVLSDRVYHLNMQYKGKEIGRHTFSITGGNIGNSTIKELHFFDKELQVKSDHIIANAYVSGCQLVKVKAVVASILKKYFD